MNGAKKIFLIILPFLLLSPVRSVSADEVGDRRPFYVNADYDFSQREKVNAVLVKETGKINFYVDENWWNFANQFIGIEKLSLLGSEFENKISPILSFYLGKEWSPGIDGDAKITVLFHQMKKEAGGYFRSNDEYEKIQISDSNEREMVYLNADYLMDQNISKSFLAHEYVHLITFNEKVKKYGVEEETWLDEARAEYVSTLLGYDDKYEGSVLEKRVQYFMEKPSGSLADWTNAKYDYGRINLFTHYLVDYYGMDVLKDSLQSPKIGTDSLNFALKKEGAKENLSDIFQNWLVAVLINDCNYGPKYCYLDKNLKNFYINPVINFLPVSGNTTLTMADNTKKWSGNWYKIIGGGGGMLQFNFDGQDNAFFKIAYITRSQSGAYSVKFLTLDKSQNGKVSIENFGKEMNAFYVIPFLQPDKNNGYSSYYFSWSASIKRDVQSSEKDEIERLTALIAELKQKIADILAQRGENSQCAITSNLFFGLANNGQVRCLQEFLKKQGPAIYPEGYVTGNFGYITKQAVIKFQEKYASEILAPAGLSSGTGYVGEKTREKINKILSI